MHFAATIERAEKQIILARHGRRLLNLLDDTPVIPGDSRPAFEHAHQARQVLNDAEEDLRDWQPNLEPIPSSATDMGTNLMPGESASTAAPSVVGQPEGQGMLTQGESGMHAGTGGGQEGMHQGGQLETVDRRDMGGSVDESQYTQ